jgi:hypothetical protein
MGVTPKEPNLINPIHDALFFLFGFVLVLVPGLLYHLSHTSSPLDAFIDGSDLENANFGACLCQRVRGGLLKIQVSGLIADLLNKRSLVDSSPHPLLRNCKHSKNSHSGPE